MKLNKKGIVSGYVYIMMLGVGILLGGMYSGVIITEHFATETLNKTKSFYASETGIEEGLLAFKASPNIDDFIPNEAIILEPQNKRKVEYTEQKVYKKELVIKEHIEAGKSIQLPFSKKDLDSRITQFHAAVLLPDQDNFPDKQEFCETAFYNGALEISAYQKAHIIEIDPLDYTVELNSNWNGCYLGNNAAGKTSLLTYTDPYSNDKVSLVGDKCVMNSKGNVAGGVFETPIPYLFNDKGDADIENNTCDMDCANQPCSIFYTQEQDVTKEINGHILFYTIAANFVWNDMSNDGLIMYNFRAVDDDVDIAIWATDDAGNPYEIPGRFINFSSLGIAQGGDLNEGVFTRLKLKKKSNSDLLPIFDYSLYSESEFIK